VAAKATSIIAKEMTAHAASVNPVSQRSLSRPGLRREAHSQSAPIGRSKTPTRPSIQAMAEMGNAKKS
jgi:hypothetical protein